MVIKKIWWLGNTPLRRDALQIAEAGYEALEINRLFAGCVSQKDQALCFQQQDYDLQKYRRIYLVGVGKGSARAAKAILPMLPKKKLAGGAVIDISRQNLGNITSFAGTHPLPSEQNIAATLHIIRLLKEAQKDDLVITIVCGGGSSLFCQPGGGLTCTDLQHISDYLLKSGANIEQINTVRKHLSYIHGGNVSKYAYPAHVLGLIISDVPGNKLEMIASGPTVRDSTTVGDAQKIGQKFGLRNVEFVETPKQAKYFTNVTNVILASGNTALVAMQAKAHQLGYRSAIFSSHLQGMAKTVGPEMARACQPGQALLACGETQVHVTHQGIGGRNQDVALSALKYLPKNAAIVACASDGKDNIWVGGGITDGQYAAEKARKLGLNPTSAVTHNQSYKSLRKLRGIFKTRRFVTANVSDFIVVLREKP